MKLKSILSELKRRNVYKIAAAYIIGAWLIVQAGSILLPTFNAQPWVMRVLVLVLIIGFPIALMISWAFELSPEGLKRTDKSGLIQKITTFVFSDIQHSTQLAQQLREDYPEILNRHRTVIREAIKNHRGKEIDTAGDGFFMTFENPASAVHATVEMQKRFYSEEWAREIGLKVRMSIHTGLALPTESGYTGVEVHKASRICNAAYGGQILLSNATHQYLKEGFTEELSFSSLGEFILKDFSDPVELFQLNIPGIERHFPNPRIAPDDKRIVVLPFVNLSKDPDHEYVGEGLADEISSELRKVQGLRVVSRATAFAIKDEEVNVIDLGQKLNVSSVLKGQVNVSNGQMKISVDLVDTTSGQTMWSGQYHNAKEQLLATQDEIKQKIIDALECRIIPNQLDSIQERQTQIAEAYDFYLRGRRFYLQFSNSSIELAIQMFEKAIESDHTYALAYAGLADCYSYQFQHKAPSAEILNMAEDASKMAIELAPGLAEVYASRGIVMALKQQFREAETAFRYSIELDPTLFLGWFHYARMNFTIGKQDKAARLFEQANLVDPDDYQSILLSAQSYHNIGCYDLAQTLRARGVSTIEKRLEINPGDTRALYLAANALVFLGQKEKSLAFLQRALLLEPDDSMLLYNAGCIYALLGMQEEAISCLERSYKAGLTLLGWYENDADLDSLRGDSRFISLLERIKKDLS